jgi:hypothetical protein
MAADSDSAVETEQQMLAYRFDALETAAIDCGSDSREEPPRMRRARAEPVPDERTESRGRTMEGVAFGHEGTRKEP